MREIVGDGRGLSARGRTPAETSALDGNPIEHGNIQVFEPGGQSRHRAMGLRHHDLRIRDHGVERFDHGVVTARASWGAPYPHRIVCTKAASRMVDEVLKDARANGGARLPVGVPDDETLPVEPRVRLSGRYAEVLPCHTMTAQGWSYLSKREAADLWAAIRCLGRNLRTVRGILRWAGDSLTGSGNLQ
jgi:hypothetical protein